MISGYGPTSTSVIIVADGASDGDISSGYALSGDAGRIVASFCTANNLKYDTFYKTALIKDRINLKDPKSNYPLLSEQYKEILLNEINSIRPNVIVPLSELSFSFLTGLTNIRKFRGSVLPATNSIISRIIPILGPNPYLYEDRKLEFISRLDFGKVARNLYNSDPIKEIGLCWIAKTGVELHAFIERSYSKAQFLVFDIETFYGIPTCISFCFDGWESVCVPFLDWNISQDNRIIMLNLVLKLLRSSIPKVNQNVKFDWRKLEKIGAVINGISGDTMLAASCIYAEFPKNLGFLTSLYTDMPYFKDEGKEFDHSIHSRDRLYLYNAKDSLATSQIYSQQREEIVELGLSTVYNMLIEILPIYKEMEDNGLLVDDTRRCDLLSKYMTLFDIYCTKLYKLTGKQYNPLSSTQMQKLVYEELKFKKIRGIGYTPKGSPKADEESLELLIWMSSCDAIEGKEILRTIIDCRKLHKVIEVLSLPLFPDNRMRCEFNLSGAWTGRTTSGETTDYHLYFKDGKVKSKNLGHSFQNIGKHGFTVDGIIYGKELRSIFVPSQGYSFVETDLSQAEARVDAILAIDFNILSAFDSPTGIHRLTGSWIFECPPEDIKKDITLDSRGIGEDRYYISKTVRHAGERNMREDRLMLMIHKPIQECIKVLNTFHTKQPNIRNVFHREVREQLQNKRLLVAPNGRRRDFFGKFDTQMINDGISFLPQAIVTDYTKQSLKKTVTECRDYIRPILESHDGFMSEVRSGREEEYSRIFKKNIEVPIDFRTCSLARDYELTIPCEVGIGKDNWQEIKEVKI